MGVILPDPVEYPGPLVDIAATLLPSSIHRTGVFGRRGRRSPGRGESRLSRELSISATGWLAPRDSSGIKRATGPC